LVGGQVVHLVLIVVGLLLVLESGDIKLLVLVVAGLLELLDFVHEEVNFLLELLHLLGVSLRCVFVLVFPFALFDDEVDVVLRARLQACTQNFLEIRLDLVYLVS